MYSQMQYKIVLSEKSPFFACFYYSRMKFLISLANFSYELRRRIEKHQSPELLEMNSSKDHSLYP